MKKGFICFWMMLVMLTMGSTARAERSGLFAGISIGVNQNSSDIDALIDHVSGSEETNPGLSNYHTGIRLGYYVSQRLALYYQAQSSQNGFWYRKKDPYGQLYLHGPGMAYYFLRSSSWSPYVEGSGGFAGFRPEGGQHERSGYGGTLGMGVEFTSFLQAGFTYTMTRLEDSSSHQDIDTDSIAVRLSLLLG